MSDIKVKQVNLQKILSNAFNLKTQISLTKVYTLFKLTILFSMQKLLIKVCKFQFDFQMNNLLKDI
jgi:hypothetical protein